MLVSKNGKLVVFEDRSVLRRRVEQLVWAPSELSLTQSSSFHLRVFLILMLMQGWRGTGSSLGFTKAGSLGKNEGNEPFISKDR